MAPSSPCPKLPSLKAPDLLAFFSVPHLARPDPSLGPLLSLFPRLGHFHLTKSCLSLFNTSFKSHIPREAQPGACRVQHCSRSLSPGVSQAPLGSLLHPSPWLSPLHAFLSSPRPPCFSSSPTVDCQQSLSPGWDMGVVKHHLQAWPVPQPHPFRIMLKGCLSLFTFSCVTKHPFFSRT